MDLAMFTVDAFAKSPFGGNPAAVCIIKHNQPIDDEMMQHIAHEMNLSETAYVQELKANDLSNGERFGLRWFTPTNEVKLCGHATLASAAIVFHKYANCSQTLKFDTLSGELTAERDGDLIVLDLPLADITDQVPDVAYSVIKLISPKLDAVKSELEIHMSPSTQKLLVRLPQSWTREDLESLAIPDVTAMLTAHDGSILKGVILTTNCLAHDTTDQPYDFISRYFAPWNGIPEDPVTGSAHTVLGKYWSQQLRKTQLYARQCSSRGGDLTLRLDNENNRIFIGGPACIILSGSIHLPLEN